MRKSTRRYDLARLIKGLAVVLVLVFLLNFVFSIYTAAELSRSVLNSSHQDFSKAVTGIENQIDKSYENLVYELAYDKDIDDLEEGKVTADTIASERRIKSVLSKWSSSNQVKMNYAIYVPESGREITGCDTDASYNEWREISKDILHYMEHSAEHMGWQIVSIDGADYLIRAKRYNKRYAACWCRIQEIEKVLLEAGHGMDAYVVLTDEENYVYDHKEELEQDGVDLFREDSSVIMSLQRGYILVNEEFLEGLKLHMVMKNYQSILQVMKLQFILGIILVCVLLMIIGVTRLIVKTLVNPIQRFTENIDKLNADENYSVATHYQINELGKASELLANMVDKIKSLKIDIYEKTLEQQKVRMDFLTLQIEPHFYLNCLNVIYHMASLGKYKEIMQLSKCASVYLRYIFKSKDTMVCLGEELEHVKNYMEIQEIRYKGHFHTEWDVDAEIIMAQIPPLVLQTFVENTIKYAMNWDYDVIIRIQVKKQLVHDEVYVVLMVEDNGEGFEAEVLQKLQEHKDISEGEKRIGIMNVIERLRLAFSGKAEVEFNNIETGGASIRVRIPYQCKEVTE